MQTQAYPHEKYCRDMLGLAATLHDITNSLHYPGVSIAQKPSLRIGLACPQWERARGWRERERKREGEREGGRE